MSPIITIAAIVLAVACMMLAQKKNISRRDRIAYSLLGGLTCAVIMFDCINRGENGSALMFMCASLCSFAGLVKNYLTPTKP